MIEKRPIQRSKLRIIVGRCYFTMKRYYEWFLSGKRYAALGKHKVQPLPFIVFTHSTPLLRKLQGIDMQLQYNKIKNLKLACERLNGVVVKQGETFSYWKLIGRPTKEKGYVDGLVLTPNGGFKPGVGGGLCQLSNLIYWMTLHTPLTVTERHRHSFDYFPDENRTQPFGTGATCAYCSYDLQLCNRTPEDYQLTVYLTDDYLVGQWRSTLEPMNVYEVYEKEHAIMSGYRGAIRKNVICRKTLSRNIGLIKDELITENHAYMTYSPFIGSTDVEK